MKVSPECLLSFSPSPREDAFLHPRERDASFQVGRFFKEGGRASSRCIVKRSFEDGRKDGGIQVDRILFFFLAFDRLDRIVG